MSGTVLTASHVAIALVAAARVRGVDAAGIYGPGGANRKARVLAAASLGARLNVKKGVLAKLFQLHGPELAPSMLAKAEVTTDAMLEVNEALLAAGLSLSGVSGVSVVSEDSCPQPPAASAPPSRKARKAVDDGTVAGAGIASPRCAPAVPRVVAAPPLEEVAPPARVSRAGSFSGPVPVDRRPVSRLKPVTAQIARWGGYFLEAGWEGDEVADLFDVSPEALIDALDPASAEVAP